jgi:hypothetical protein
MLQAWRWRVRDAIRPLKIFSLPNASCSTRPWGLFNQ